MTTPQKPPEVLAELTRERPSRRANWKSAMLNWETFDSLLSDAAALPGVIAERDELKRRVEWQPIETHDGSRQDVLINDDGFVCEAWFDDEAKGWWRSNTHQTDVTDGQVFPTHWMPLPAPPSMEGRE